MAELNGETERESLNPIAEQIIQKARHFGASKLDLNNLALVNIPESIRELTQLRILDLSFNQPEELPEYVTELVQLQELSLVGNKLASVPDSVGRLTKLRTLYLTSNQLDTLPASMTQLTQLEGLFLEKNRLASLPEWLGELRRLYALNLYDNLLTDLPKSLSKLTVLEELGVSAGGDDTASQCRRQRSLQPLVPVLSMRSTHPRHLCPGVVRAKSDVDRLPMPGPLDERLLV